MTTTKIQATVLVTLTYEYHGDDAPEVEDMLQAIAADPATWDLGAKASLEQVMR